MDMAENQYAQPQPLGPAPVQEQPAVYEEPVASPTVYKQLDDGSFVPSQEESGIQLYDKVTNADGSITFTPKAMMGGKRSKKSKSKKGGDPAGVVTAGTLFLIQAAARKVLKKQKGGQVIASSPAPLTSETPVVGGSFDCGAKAGGAKKSRKQRGGMAELKEAFNTMVTEMQQTGGKKKSRKQRGGAMCEGAPLETAFPGIDSKIVNEQTGGKKKARKQRGGMADLKEAFESYAPVYVPPPSQEGGKKKARKQRGGNTDSLLQTIQQSIASMKA
jgi:hypothetical protein